MGVYGTQVRWRYLGQTGAGRCCTGVALLGEGEALCLSMDEENHVSLKVTCANRNFSDPPALRGKIHNLLRVLTLFYILSRGKTASTCHGATGNQGVSCPQRLRSRRLPRNQRECGIYTSRETQPSTGRSPNTWRGSQRRETCLDKRLADTCLGMLRSGLIYARFAHFQSGS